MADVSGRAADAEVAEKVMGLRLDEPPSDLVTLDWSGHRPLAVYPNDWWPRYTTDAGADRLVLERVAATWDESAKWRFVREVARLLKVRDCDYTTFGTLSLVLFGNGPSGTAPGLFVGLWSRAALAALSSDRPAP